MWYAVCPCRFEDNKLTANIGAPTSFQPQSPPCKIDPTAHGEEAARSLKFSPFPVAAAAAAAARRSCAASRSSRSLSSLPEAAKTNGLAPAT
ncbi:hypothetical protein DAI22_11g200100 [Oryza sativa Japonica Group]|nr:hypothetical protein DAI22_11g200100 [Oryza sativa Japonica Group]